MQHNLTFINLSFTFFSFLISYFTNSSHEGGVTVDFRGDSVDLQVVPPVSSHYEEKIMSGKKGHDRTPLFQISSALQLSSF